jgi:Leucine Rich repeat
LDRHRPGELSLYDADRTLDISDDVHLDTLQRRGFQVLLHYQGDVVHQWRHSPSGGCSLCVRFNKCGSDGVRTFGHDTEEFVFDNDTNMWLLAAGLYLEGERWLEREVGRENAGYEWQSSSRGKETLRRMSENDPTLTKLSFYNNSIGDAGASALAEALKVNKTLTELVVYRNIIGDAGASALAEALKVNKTLTELNVYGNSIGAAGASALVEALKVNNTLTELDVSGNSISKPGKTALRASARPDCTVYG